MSMLLQRSTRTFIYSISQNHWLLTACTRLKSTGDVLDETPSNTTSGNAKATQNSPLVKITLIQPNQSMTVTSLKEAQKLAKRRDLHLIKQQDLDTKTQRPVYKLLTAAELLSEDVDENVVNKKKSADKPEKKSEKALTIGSRISEHDLASRTKHISKWLAKNHHVCVLIQGSPNEMAKCEHIAKTIEQSINEPTLIGRIVQKRSKGSHVRFNIVPVAKENEQKQQPA